ncbi:ArsR-like helix-turn-helix domain-containing protein [Dioscorea alata]|uniref:ArsR-like helix-turn-helix domain-containing protein n=1 Tax=Dioscorea alata TaxID=55571 RepID=A0ACB7VEQ7_DIOAL|nr:ArsR-like helix-turn-helix domain-containing protein [Dioscorea alata]
MVNGKPEIGSIGEGEGKMESTKGGKKPEPLVLGEEWPKLGDLEQRSGKREAYATVRVSDLQSIGGVPIDRSSSLPGFQAQPQASKDMQRCNGDKIGNHYNGPFPQPAMINGPQPFNSCHHPSSQFQEVVRHVYQAYPHQNPFPYNQQQFFAPPPYDPFVNYHQTTAYGFNQAHTYHVEQNSRPNPPTFDHRFRSKAFIRRCPPNFYADLGFTNNPYYYGHAPPVPYSAAAPYSPAASVGVRTPPFDVSSTSHYHNSFQGQHKMDKRASIVRQVEYYFSDENLPSDHHLLSLLDEDGWVSIHCIASFRRLHNLAKNNTRLILDVLRSSNFIEIRGDKIRRSDWSKWIQASRHHASSSKSHATIDPSHLNHKESNNVGVSNDFLSKSSLLQGEQRTPVTAEQSNLDQIMLQKDCLSCNNSTDNNDGLNTITQNLHNVKIIAEPGEDCKN